MGELPRGTVTFLFTDIEESTDLVRKLGERYAALLADHRRLLRAAFAENGGSVIDTQGDAFFVAFDRVRDGVLAATAVQRSLAAHEWAWEPVPRVRIGLHTSEPHVWEEGYVGVGVHRANRICAAGHGGQVLLSRSTAGLAADEELEGIGLVDLGDHRLKGLDRPERIFQLVIDGLETDFPPLNTIEGAGRSTETATVLYADLAGLTHLGQELAPEQFRTLVADYHRTLDRVLTETGGTATTAFGDTALALYRSALQAVTAAASLQRTVAEHEWPAGSPVKVNVALDSGDVIITGHGPFGSAVNRCARICEHSSGGQVLLSEATRSLLLDEELGELELLELDERELTDAGRPLRIYQLFVPGLPASLAAAQNQRL